jgi:hypothetical protein
LASSPEKGGGSPGSSTLEVSIVVLVVDDEARVELVANGLVVAVVLLVLARTVDDVVVALGRVELVEEADAVLVVPPAGATTTTPTMPLWILQWYGYVPEVVNRRCTVSPGES